MHRPNPRPACRALAATLLTLLVAGATPTAASAQTGDQHDMPVPATQPEVVIHAFGSVDWAAADQHDTPQSFGLGQFSLFVTAALNERVSVLAEVVMEGSGANTRVVTDLERLQLTYRLDDHLNLSAGRYHTGIGYYNAAFHHGSYFEIPIGRPRIFAFEDEGGVLPVHEVGLSARGAVPKTASALRYVAEVGNGRRWTDVDDADEDRDEGRDQNGAKSTNIGLALRPERWRGAEIGASFYRDRIPVGTQPTITHQIAAAYAVYRTPSTEIMGEWLQLSHRLPALTRYTNHGGYLQASRAFGKIRPYYRYDRLDIKPDTPLIGSFGSSTVHLAGIRLDPADWIGLKAQYERLHDDHVTGSDAVHVQLVFVF